MKAPQDIILRPVITEASMANVQLRIEIAKAVEALFPGAKVSSVNTISCRGRLKRMGRNQGYTPSFKKAIVTLTEGSKTIEFFDTML